MNEKLDELSRKNDRSNRDLEVIRNRLNQSLLLVDKGQTEISTRRNANGECQFDTSGIEGFEGKDPSSNRYHIISTFIREKEKTHLQKPGVIQAVGHAHNITSSGPDLYCYNSKGEPVAGMFLSTSKQDSRCSCTGSLGFEWEIYAKGNER